LRLPVPLAWLILGLAFFTAAILRQFHDRTPESPLAPPLVGSLLFAGIFFLLLVSAREWRRGAVAGKGVRLGSVTPLLLMLLIEKWISISVYPAVFRWLARDGADPRWLDAQFWTLAGVGLILACLLVGRLSRPTARKTWRRARPSRWLFAAAATALVVGGSYTILLLLGWVLGANLQLHWPSPGPLLGWILGGQALLAFAEEIYYRGLLMSEVERLAPRLGVRGPSARRWLALLFTAGLFGIEHLTLGPPWGHSARQLIFATALGVLLGILVMVSANLHFAAGVHAWINWLLLGAAPYLVHEGGRPAIPPGTYIGLTLILAFVLVFVFQRWRRRQAYGEPGELMDLGQGRPG
jgi:membrane protease YdiL (CAAX protease family)